MLKPQVSEEYVQIDQLDWAPFPSALCEGPIRWKLLHVSPERGAWTAVFDCPAGTSFNAHVHIGPGEYFLTKGRMDVRGGVQKGGATAIAPGYGYESSGARHDHTNFPVDSEFTMTFTGPLQFITPDAQTLALVGWQEVQGAWDAFVSSKPAQRKAA